MSRRLRLKFGLASEGTRVISLDSPKTSLDAAAVSGAMSAMVTNGDIFDDPLTSALRGEIIETTTTVLVNNED